MTEEIIHRSGRFSETERRQIAAIAAAVIPEDRSLGAPGAHDPQILAVVLDKVAAQAADRVKSGLRQLAAELGPSDPAPDKLLDLLEGDGRFKALLQMLTIAILQGYYQDPRVLALHGLAPRPPFPEGHHVAAGDWSLLEPVKGRGPIYRPV